MTQYPPTPGPPTAGWPQQPAPKKRVRWLVGGILALTAVGVIGATIQDEQRSAGVTESTQTVLIRPSRTFPVTTSVQPKPDRAGEFACDDFASGYRQAQTRQARVDLANKVNEWAPQSTSGRIADMGRLLGRGADGTPRAWEIAADGFAQACFDAGWKS